MRAYTLDQLPTSLPIFPLTGVLLLPYGQLPLNIFEPRYLAMVDDAMRGDRLIGMVQPRDGEASAQGPSVYAVGCAGRITSYAETDDGRFLITLTGVCRFHAGEELPLKRGYRRIVPEWRAFAGDLETPPAAEFDRDRLLQLLRGYFSAQGLSANWDAIQSAPADRLVTSLSMICPFEPSEKQALLEAGDNSARAEVMMALMEMAIAERGGGGGTDVSKQ
jgi:Lon protease-like protein